MHLYNELLKYKYLRRYVVKNDEVKVFFYSDGSFLEPTEKNKNIEELFVHGS